jgi:hypothetical protein
MTRIGNKEKSLPTGRQAFSHFLKSESLGERSVFLGLSLVSLSRKNISLGVRG